MKLYTILCVFILAGAVVQAATPLKRDPYRHFAEAVDIYKKNVRRNTPAQNLVILNDIISSYEYIERLSSSYRNITLEHAHIKLGVLGKNVTIATLRQTRDALAAQRVIQPAQPQGPATAPQRSQPVPHRQTATPQRPIRIPTRQPRQPVRVVEEAPPAYELPPAYEAAPAYEAEYVGVMREPRSPSHTLVVPSRNRALSDITEDSDEEESAQGSSSQSVSSTQQAGIRETIATQLAYLRDMSEQASQLQAQLILFQDVVQRVTDIQRQVQEASVRYQEQRKRAQTLIDHASSLSASELQNFRRQLREIDQISLISSDDRKRLERGAAILRELQTLLDQRDVRVQEINRLRERYTRTITANNTQVDYHKLSERIAHAADTIQNTIEPQAHRLLEELETITEEGANDHPQMVRFRERPVINVTDLVPQEEASSASNVTQVACAHDHSFDRQLHHLERKENALRHSLSALYKALDRQNTRAENRLRHSACRRADELERLLNEFAQQVDMLQEQSHDQQFIQSLRTRIAELEIYISCVNKEIR